MISFILVGKNVERTITVCISSVERFVSENRIQDYEILYIDSASTDKSLTLAGQFNISSYLIEGRVNAAVARNTGASFAKGEILFFLDTDMEILSDVDKSIFLDKANRLVYPLIRGGHHHLHYDSNFNYLYTRHDVLPKEPVYSNVTGGFMIVDRDSWRALGGMDERLKRNQDVDFGLRMSGFGYPALLQNKYLVNHHTISYYNDSRLKDFLLSSALFSPGLLLRKHFFNPMYLKHYYKSLFYTIFLFLIVISIIASPRTGLFLTVIYLLIQFGRAVRHKSKHDSLFSAFIYKALYPGYTLVGFLAYFPSKPVYSITKIR